MATTIGLTPAGLVVERLPEARERVVEIWRGKFGQGSPTRTGTENGLVIDVAALLVVLLWETAEAVDGGSYLATAQGIQLDLWVAPFGFSRIQPSPSSAAVILFGTASATAAAGTLAEVSTTATQWALVDEVELGPSPSATLWVVTVDEAASGVVYSITLGATLYSILVELALDVEAIADLLAGLVNAGSQATADVVGVDAEGRAVIVVESLAAAFTATSSARTTTHSAGRGVVEAVVDGPTTAGVGVIDGLAGPTAGISGLISTAEADVGSDLETDAELRRRFLLGAGRRERGTTRAVRAGLLALAEAASLDYYEATIRENTTPAEVGGIPPHSIAPLVYLPTVTDAEVAASIAEARPAGIRSFGSTEVEVADAGSPGGVVVIGFTRATERYLHVRVTVVTAGEGWPDEGDPVTAIETAIAAWLTTPGVLRVGVDLYRLNVIGVALAALPVSAIADANVELATTLTPLATPSFAAADLVVAETEILIPSSARVTVVGP